jgi:hypothetical protein
MKTEQRVIKWLTLENSEGTRTLKQHGFIPKVCKERWTGDPYDGNISLCRKVWSSEDGEYAQDWSTIDGENIKESHCCKTCLKESKKYLLPSTTTI